MVCTRVHEPQETISAATIALEISSRNSRVSALQKRWDRLRAGLDLILDQRGGYGRCPRRRRHKGKDADRCSRNSRVAALQNNHTGPPALAARSRFRAAGRTP